MNDTNPLTKKEVWKRLSMARKRLYYLERKYKFFPTHLIKAEIDFIINDIKQYQLEMDAGDTKMD